ncbi:MAG: hypothetical protein U1E73_11665 [Planctomycetota bacterium]
MRILIDEKVACSCRHDLGLPRGDALSLQVQDRVVWLEGLEWKPLQVGGGKK